MTREEFTKRLDAFLSQFPNYLDTPEGKEGIRQLQENLIKKYLSMYKYKFKAKDLKTGEWVEGDLAYVKQLIFRKGKCVEYREKPMIVKMCCHGGMLYATTRHFIDEGTIELITENK